MNAAEIAAYTVEHGGGTFDRAGNPVEPVNGYAVGIAQGTQALLAPSATPAMLASAMHRVAQEFEVNFIGVWVRPDGWLAIDPVRVMTFRAAALDAGRYYGQQAIYGFAEQQAIEVSGYEEVRDART
jgi:hypothetical protein